ncbi:MAG: hypothetical protein OXG97_13835 [Candidatus Poribacteria bacterium]|nr:hypothetical protein [Candidatus Poribacteria bacterium]
MKNPLHFRYTHTCYNREGGVIAHDTGTLEGYTLKSIKLTLVKRFRLQGTGGNWTCLPNGTHKRSHRNTATGERSTLILEPIRGT